MFESIEKKKKILDIKRPFSRIVLDNLKKYYDVEFTYNSNAIEGNTLTLTETKLVIEDGLTVGEGKTMKEHLEAINHKEAIDYIEDITKKNIEIRERVIREIHYIVLRKINDDVAGRYRTNNVRISGSEHKPIEHVFVQEKMNELMNWYEENKNKLHPVEFAAIFHHKFTFIHPFIDGNGRTGRLLMNLIFIKNGYPPAVIRVKDRKYYMNALEKASIESDYADFIQIVADAVERSLDNYIDMLS